MEVRDVNEEDIEESAAPVEVQDRPADALLPPPSVGEVVRGFAPVGLVTFGGPHAHIALLLARFVDELRWMTAAQFAELMALGSSLPGPTSTQMVLALGLVRGGLAGGAVSFAMFTFPAAAVLFTLVSVLWWSGATNTVASAAGMPPLLASVTDGMAVAAVGLMAVAFAKLALRILDSPLPRTFCLTSCIALVMHTRMWMFPLLIAVEAPLYLALYELLHYYKERTSTAQPSPSSSSSSSSSSSTSSSSSLSSSQPAQPAQQSQQANSAADLPPLAYGLRTSAAMISVVALAFVLVFGARALLLPDSTLLTIASGAMLCGSLVVGGGYVVIPMLAGVFVADGLLDESVFFSCFALINALPGPMFNVSILLGGLAYGPIGAAVCWLSLFGPGLMFKAAALPLWSEMRRHPRFQVALAGACATALGFLLASVLQAWSSIVLRSGRDAGSEFNVAAFMVAVGIASSGPSFLLPPVAVAVCAALFAGRALLIPA